MKKIIAILTIIWLTGCASAGVQIDPAQIQDIEKGVTTEQEVKNMFGSPNSSGITAEGELFYVYTFARSTTNAATFIPVVGLFAGGSNTDIEMLQIWFDSERKVKEYHFNKSNMETRLGR
ncbi:hypothetical protein CWE12_10665 [Aliidiomarina sedimenti]|uniref:Outer membrane protein assembly factor BamE domain-containing protein n=1 Tax=Aliidiomarina sedimenti TaxID=1933879 RepID=A0ABY0BX03_9GAMM|nr:outer membrane protein assembly factor BamE [Aliidiomarina sedimenti]RUO28768.1 hypothetical protein CWE12_10665 [Aliidiomarina sedimenti]